MHHHVLRFVFAGSLLLGCGSSASDGQMKSQNPASDVEPQPATGCDALKLPQKNYAAQFQLSVPLEPGSEREVCALHQVGPDEIRLNYSELAVSRGSHHGLLWQTSYTELPELDRRGDPIEIDKLVSCEGSANSRFDVSGVLAGSQGQANLTAAGVLPSNVALTIAPNSYVVSNFHMLNTTEQPIEGCLKFGLIGIPASQVEHEAGALFFYNPFIAVARGASASARMACPASQPLFLKSAVSHMHQHGVRYSANLLAGDPFDPQTTVIEHLYDTNTWDTPQDRIWDEALPIDEGRWIDFQCDYENTTERDVAQGLETTDEMCMFNGMYWPANSAQSFCQKQGKNAGTVGSAGYQIGSGHLDCESFVTCMLTSVLTSGATETLCGFEECKNYSARFNFQRCFIDACEAIGAYTRPYLNCFSANSSACSQQCKDQPTSCALACLNEDHCKAEADTLLHAKCD
jgi:hypothetical protein